MSAINPHHHAGGPSDTNETSHGSSMPTYVAVFVALLVLLVVTVAVAFVDLGPLNLAVALLIAGVKATLVVLYFMHVRHSNRLTKVFVAGTYLWLVILFVLTYSDYISRNWLPNSRGWDENPVLRQVETGERHGGTPTKGAEFGPHGEPSERNAPDMDG